MALVAGGGYAARAQNPAPAYFQNMNDLPLMPGLFEVLEDAVVFDKPEGRILESTAIGKNAQPAEIMEFYAKTLPALGWKPLGAGQYARGHEALGLAAVRQGNDARLRVTLEPLP